MFKHLRAAVFTTGKKNLIQLTWYTQKLNHYSSLSGHDSTQFSWLLCPILLWLLQLIKLIIYFSWGFINCCPWSWISFWWHTVVPSRCITGFAGYSVNVYSNLIILLWFLCQILLHLSSCLCSELNNGRMQKMYFYFFGGNKFFAYWPACFLQML